MPVLIFRKRLRIVELLLGGHSYQTISERVGVSKGGSAAKGGGGCRVQDTTNHGSWPIEPGLTLLTETEFLSR